MSTKIEWCEETWSPVIGCSKVGPACLNCYAARMATRLAANPQTPDYKGIAAGGEWSGEARCLPHRLGQPLRWRKARRIFVCSMSDLFHPSVPFEFIAAIFSVMAACPQHEWMILTKRPERMRAWFAWANYHYDGMNTTESVFDAKTRDEMTKLWVDRDLGNLPWPLPNVMLGATIWDQSSADSAIPVLLDTPAEKRFVSVEPMLGEIDIRYPRSIWPKGPDYCCSGRDCGCLGIPTEPPLTIDLNGNRIDLVIAGAETGPGKRPMGINWVRNLRDQCVDLGTSFFFKKDSDGNHELDGETWEQMP